MNKKKIKTLFLASTYPSKLGENVSIFIKRHAESVAIFCDVVVLVIIKDDSLKGYTYIIDVEEEKNIKTIRLFYKTKKFIKPISFFYKALYYMKYHLIGYKYIIKKFGKPDIAHVNTIFPIGMFAVFLKMFKRIPYIITEHQSYYLPYVNNSEYYKFFSRRIITKFVIKYASIITTVSERVKLAMLEIGLKGSYLVIPNVFFNKNFYPLKKEKVKKKKILHVSLLGDEKNIEGILYVINLLKKRDDFYLTIVGDGKNRKKFEKIAHDYQLLGKYVRFSGFKKEKEIGMVMRESSFLLMFSKFENFPCVIVEAMASGLPIISSNVGGISEHVNENNGILVKSENKKDLLDCIEYMLDNYDNYDINYIVNYAKNNFSYDIVGKQFEEVYKNVLKV